VTSERGARRRGARTRPIVAAIELGWAVTSADIAEDGTGISLFGLGRRQSGLAAYRDLPLGQRPLGKAPPVIVGKRWRTSATNSTR
jgi:hypothetical protein